MQYHKRLIEDALESHLKRKKSIMLLGPRQTGKSTLLKKLSADLTLTFLESRVRQRYEKDPDLLLGEVAALKKKDGKLPLVILDEIQKVPDILDVVQKLIDDQSAQFVLTGSSARKLRKHHVNLLPGRVVSMRLDPFVYLEGPDRDLVSVLLYGTLPGIVNVENDKDRETDLQSYVETYLEEEVRAEALVRQMGAFIRFMELAGIESGNIVNFQSIASDIGVAHTTVAAYYEVLEDCLIVERIDPITRSASRKKLSRSSRYLLFDVGVRRLCALEGNRLSRERLGQIFEQYVGLELIRLARAIGQNAHIRYWRDPDGPEVDYVIESNKTFIPIEVKWTDIPLAKHARHLNVFLEEYKEAKKGYVICRTPRVVQLTDRVQAWPWQKLHELLR